MPLNDLVSAVLESIRNPPRELVLFEATLENYTPVMVGDYDTRTWRRYGQQGLEPARTLLAQGMLGRMRWLLRLAVASLSCRDNADSYKDLEDSCKVKVYYDGKGPKSLGLVKALMGFVSRSESFASPFTLQATLVLPNNAGTPGPTRPSVWSMAGRREGLHDRFNALMSRGSEFRLLAPVEPCRLRVALRVLAQPRTEWVLGDEWPKLGALYVALAIMVPTLFGIGKGVNRGFGRFIFTGNSYYINESLLRSSRELNNLINSLKGLGYIVDRCPDAAANYRRVDKTQAKALLEDAFQSLLSLAANATGSGLDSSLTIHVPSIMGMLEFRGPPPSICGASGVTAPSARGARVEEMKGINVAGIAMSGPGKPIDRALEAIGRAVFKSTWKSGEKKKSTASSDSEYYNTWPLGLPRFSKIKVSSGRGHEEVYVYKGYLPDEKMGGSLRRQSMVVLFPLPALGTKNEPLVAALPLISDDVLNKLIEPGHIIFVGDFNNKYKKDREALVKDLLEKAEVGEERGRRREHVIITNCPESICIKKPVKSILAQGADKIKAADSVSNICPDSLCEGCRDDQKIKCYYYLAICRAYYSVVKLLEEAGEVR